MGDSAGQADPYLTPNHHAQVSKRSLVCKQNSLKLLLYYCYYYYDDDDYYYYNYYYEYYYYGFS